MKEWNRSPVDDYGRNGWMNYSLSKYYHFTSIYPTNTTSFFHSSTGLRQPRTPVLSGQGGVGGYGTSWTKSKIGFRPQFSDEEADPNSFVRLFSCVDEIPDDDPVRPAFRHGAVREVPGPDLDRHSCSTMTGLGNQA